MPPRWQGPLPYRLRRTLIRQLSWRGVSVGHADALADASGSAGIGVAGG